MASILVLDDVGESAHPETLRKGAIHAEFGFLLILIAGVWLVAAEIPVARIQPARRIVAGTALAVAGVRLNIATHWGYFG